MVTSFLLALLILTAGLCVPGQPATEGQVGWDVASCWDCDHTAEMVGTAILALPAGIFLGFLRAITFQGWNVPKSILHLDPRK